MSLDWRIRSCGNSIATQWNSRLWSMVKHGVPCWGIGPRWTTFFSEMHGIVWVCMGLRMALPRTFPRLASGWASWQKLHVWGMIRWLRISKHFLIPLTMPSFDILRGIWGNLPVYSCLENSGTCGTLFEQHIWAFLVVVEVWIPLLKISRFGGIAGQLQFCQGIQSDVTRRMSSMLKGGLCLYAKLVYCMLRSMIVCCCWYCCNVDIACLSLNFWNDYCHTSCWCP